MEKTDKKNIIDWLFSADNETAETKEIKMTRLSKIRGEDVIFIIKSLGFDDICHYRAIQDDSRRQIAMVLAGVLSPNLRDKDAYRAAGFASAADAVKQTAAAGINTGAHMILGLPGDDAETIMSQPAILSELPLKTLKLHQLQIIRGTRMAKEYEQTPERFRLFGMDEYIDMIIGYIERLRPDMVLERFVTQSPDHLLIAPHWGLKNYEFVEKLKKRMTGRNTYQGRLYKCRM